MDTDFRLVTEVMKYCPYKDTTIDQRLIFTTGTIERYVISSLHDVIRYHCNLIENAQSTIYLTTSFWESTSLSASMICESLKKICIQFPCIKVRLIVDNGKLKNMFSPRNQRLISRSDWEKEIGLDPSIPNDIVIKSIHKPLLGTIHAKFMIIDQKISVVSSNNIQDRPNIELAISFKGNVSKGFCNIFDRLWSGDPNIETSNTYSSGDVDSDMTSNDLLPIIFANRAANGGLVRDVKSMQNYAWWSLMSLAIDSIVICSPTFNANHAIEGVFIACKRNVTVTVILTKNFNDKKEALPFQGGTNEYVMKRLHDRLKNVDKESRLITRWYKHPNETRPRRGFHSHVKLMIIDDKIMIFGNGNMDSQSWYHSMEVNLLTESKVICTDLLDFLMENSMVC